MGRKILSLLHDLPTTSRAGDYEVLQFIEKNGLMGKGLGYIDLHLLMSALLNRVSLWTLDKRLQAVALKLLPLH